MFLQFKNANVIHYIRRLNSMVIKKNVQKMSSVHGTRVLTSKTKNDEMTEVNNSVFLLAKHFLTKMSII